MRRRSNVVRGVIPVGVVVGLLLGAALGGVVVWRVLPGSGTSAPDPVDAPRADEASYDVVVRVSEDELNRMVMARAAEIEGPITLTDGHLDLRPDAQIDFALTYEVGSLAPLINGRASLEVTEICLLGVTLQDLRVGRLHVTKLVPQRVIDRLNADLQLMMIERFGSLELRLRDVDSDETILTLRFEHDR